MEAEFVRRAHSRECCALMPARSWPAISRHIAQLPGDQAIRGSVLAAVIGGGGDVLVNLAASQAAQDMADPAPAEDPASEE